MKDCKIRELIVDRLDICIVVDVFWKLLDNSIDLIDELKVTNCLLIDDGIEVEGTRWPSSLNAEELLWNVGKFEIAEFLNDRLERGFWDATNKHSVYLMHTELT